MNVKDLIALVAAENPDVAPAKIRAVVKSALGAIDTELRTAPEGRLVTPLGSVKIVVKPTADATDPSDTVRRYWLSLKRSPSDQGETPAA